MVYGCGYLVVALILQIVPMSKFVLDLPLLSIDYFPDRLCIAFLSGCLFGQEVVTDKLLLSSFQSYVAKDEADVLTRCISGTDVDPSDDEDVLEFLSSHTCFKVPTKENIKTIIIELTHQEIIQKLRYS